VQVNFEEVMARLRRLRADIAHNDSAQRFTDLEVDVFLGDAQFLDSNTMEVAGEKLHFAKAVICTGTRAFVPPIEGLDKVDYLTNETIFNLSHSPEKLMVIGGGPIGCEMAQCFQRLGVQVTLVEASGHILSREDQDAAAIVAKALQHDGVEIITNGTVQSVSKDAENKLVTIVQEGLEKKITCNAILVATGRTPNVEGLNLEAVGVEYDRFGVKVDDTLRTTNPKIYAAGDICMQYKFTHAADAAARIVIRNALFGFMPKSKVSNLVMPWCTYTDPEIAHVGLGPKEAAKRNIAIDTISVSLEHIDRAILEGENEGLLKVHLKKGSDKILGATLVSAHAGESIGELTLAIKQGIGLGVLSGLIHPYPTQAEIIKRAADAYMRTRLTPTVAKIFRKLIALQR
jgi:pyruvate/2-oxoglutarate dehydrogenase complex dihydrolipoamide dehydrogenase (E3) component